MRWKQSIVGEAAAADTSLERPGIDEEEQDLIHKHDFMKTHGMAFQKQKLVKILSIFMKVHFNVSLYQVVVELIPSIV